MVTILGLVCALLCMIIILLIIKIVSIRKAADELRLELSERMKTETNVGIDISASDKKMRALAADIDRQLKLLRKEQIRYLRGDQEVKNAITNISHDLRTPLTAICGYMDLLLQEEVTDTVKEYLLIIENRIRLLKELTEELFRYSVVMSFDFSNDKEEISLNSALEESIAAYYGVFKEKGIEPEVSIPDKIIRRQLNGQAVSRIFSNIISNAIKYSDGDFKVILEDNGVIHFLNKAKRLDEVQIGHLFERFYTVETGRSSTGLGLSIAKTLTEEMGGSIYADYKNEVLSITVDFFHRPCF